MCDPADPKAMAVREALVFTRWAIIDLAPTSLERVAAYLEALLNREPMKSGTGWDQERQVLGCLMTDLRTMVIAAGEPVGVARDLRDARTKADEVMARQRADGAIRAYDQLITEAIESDRRDRERAERDHAVRAPEPEAPAAPPAPATPAAGELPAWT